METKNVYPMKNGRFRVQLRFNGKQSHCGCYPDLATALRARRNFKRLKLLDELSKLNKEELQ